jgi:hypothetical protein
MRQRLKIIDKIMEYSPYQRPDSPPEYNLVVAIMQQGIKDLFIEENYSTRSRYINVQKTQLEARDWFFSDENDHLFSFMGCCEILGWDPKQIRQGIIKGVKLPMSPRFLVPLFIH